MTLNVCIAIAVLDSDVSIALALAGGSRAMITALNSDWSNEAVAEFQNSKGPNCPENSPPGKQPRTRLLNVVPSCLESSGDPGQRELESWQNLFISWMLQLLLLLQRQHV